MLCFIYVGSLPCTYLAHHELESVIIFIIFIIIIIIINNVVVIIIIIIIIIFVVVIIVIIIVIKNAGTEGWAREEDVDPTLELLRKYSMIVYTQADQKQKRFKVSAMPCLGVAFVGDVLM